MAKNQDKPNTNERVIENRKARHDYAILDSLECGIILRGSEVKSVRAGAVSLGEGWVKAEGSPPSLLLYGVNIAEYGPAGPIGGAGQHKPTRGRALLAHKREIVKLARQSEEKGLTIVPLKMYFKNGYAKVLIGVARGKTSHDKRESIKEREHARDIQRATSRRAR
jgi:SsrA-binding protein